MNPAIISMEVDPAIKNKLEELANLRSCEPAAVVYDLLEKYLPLYESHLEAVQEGLDDANAGRLVDHDQVVAWVDSWGTDNELEKPECG